MNQPRENRQLVADAIAIWRAGVAAVRADQLVEKAIRIENHELWIAEQAYDLRRLRRIIVVGAGKAGAGMARGLEHALGPQLLAQKAVAGWINVPDDCVQPLSQIHLHGARPPGLNEPTTAGMEGTEQILRRVMHLGPDDLCIVLLSGGGSALLPAPIAGVSVGDKQAVTKFLSGAGANIAELNTVRKQLSRIKGGGLARACTAGQMVTLVISDVLGDPLDLIASGPTFLGDESTPGQALEILTKFGGRGVLPPSVFMALERVSAAPRSAQPVATDRSVPHFVIGNNAVAVDAAGVEAVARGYSHAMYAARTLEGDAESVGRELARQALQLRDRAGPDCLITGGEPVVKLAPLAERGKGGRNQQLVLAALQELLTRQPGIAEPLAGLVVLSGGTDGEDGPTNAAGAFFDSSAVARMRELGLNPRQFLQRNDAYHFFQPLDCLLITGPTHTNVCDLRVVVASKDSSIPSVWNTKVPL